ncbi:phytochelatin synthase family protein [Sphingomonas sp. PP-CE-1G-424]|uniref:phytochelatin synthase family protein n=1 Tax=Sphingomonas sp. PP-CE-1G-424 TaxID=2135658 RepID=UPI0010DF4A05|nr:phytochelatin synthase family protein [Sphingomonas sp. PP-CE-1G-424]TCP64297.1 phytochelatin synthase [Sphingomonas sp. PP-CE-1G-424]
MNNSILSSASPRRSFWRRPLGIFALLLIILAILAGVYLRPLISYLLTPNQYAKVVSIERQPNYRDPKAMAAAWSLPVARTYRRLPYEFQGNQSFCGPTSLANVMHSLGNTSSQRAVIAGSRYDPWFGVLPGGMNLDELADLTRQRTRAQVIVVRDPTLAGFRSYMRMANDPAHRIIANFHRGPLFGRGGGHFSPILGYLADRDLILVGDVNAKYQPFLVSSERLWRAIDTPDSATGKDRGLLVVNLGAP